MTLLDRLKDLRDGDMLPLHMPGHKRTGIIPSMQDIYGYDITEIDEFDDLHDPSGIIDDIQKRFADIFGAQRAWISVNGSTAAIEAAILAVCKSGDEIIIPRGSHRSVYYAVETANLRPVYIEQDFTPGGLILPPDVKAVERACEEHVDARCVVITSPTYEGLTADIKDIARVVHAHGMKLITDAAHGAHLAALNEKGEIPDNSDPVKSGADIVILSLHKMLPAPTQTALLLESESAACDILEDRISHYMQVFISSSPSYVLMAGIGECVNYLAGDYESDFRLTCEKITKLKNRLKWLKHIDVQGIAASDIPDGYGAVPASDPFKLIISSADGTISGQDLYIGLMNNYHIQCEMFSENFALALFSTADDDSSFMRLAEALEAIDREITGDPKVSEIKEPYSRKTHIPASRMIPGEAVNKDTDRVVFSDRITGRMSGGYISVYPPGIPIVVPGEIMDENVIAQIKQGLESGLHITGVKNGMVAVLDRDE